MNFARLKVYAPVGDRDDSTAKLCSSTGVGEAAENRVMFAIEPFSNVVGMFPITPLVKGLDAGSPPVVHCNRYSE